MSEGNASVPVDGQDGRSNNLLLRTAAALVMAPCAIAIAYFGGWLWTALVTAAAIGLYVEWLAVIGVRVPRLTVIGIVILLGVGLGVSGLMTSRQIVLLVGLGVVAAALLAPERRGWATIGICYALAALIASYAVRSDEAFGFGALMLVLLVVWGTDIGGYFAGRLIGGPKLWVRVSPKKTWAGALGGFAASISVAAGFAAYGFGKTLPLLLLGAMLSVVSQLGDLFESAIKRKFGVKDSSHIIPGHGGLMDRLDGFVAAIVLAAIFGFIRGGADGVGRGLMVW